MNLFHLRIHSGETRPVLCAAILAYCSVRDWTRFCYVIGFENIRIHPSTPSTRYRICCGFIYLFPLWRADLKYPDSLSNSPHACGRKPGKEKVADLKIFGYVWTWRNKTTTKVEPKWRHIGKYPTVTFNSSLNLVLACSHLCCFFSLNSLLFRAFLEYEHIVKF